MKTNKLVIHAVLAIIGAVLAVPGFAQKQGRVGVNLVLKPVQTIHVECNPDKSNRHNRHVAAFGTTAYQVAVDSITIHVPRMGNILAGHIWAEKYRIAAYSRDVKYEKDVRSLPPSLIIYSIQVK